MSGYTQKTVIQTYATAAAGYTEVLTLDGISLHISPRTPFTIDGKRWHAIGQHTVSIDTRNPQCILTVITVIRGQDEPETTPRTETAPRGHWAGVEGDEYWATETGPTP